MIANRELRASYTSPLCVLGHVVHGGTGFNRGLCSTGCRLACISTFGWFCYSKSGRARGGLDRADDMILSIPPFSLSARARHGGEITLRPLKRVADMSSLPSIGNEHSQ